MKRDTLQLMVYGENLSGVSVNSDDAQFQIAATHKVENSSYLFVDVVLTDDAEPKNYELTFSSGDSEINFEYEIKEREFTPESHTGFSNEDIVYLIFVDRFNNGDPSNDTLLVSLDEFNYKELNGRHGGDLQGVIDKLNYLKDLGITAIWLTPTLENKMYMSYHGYAATELYNIDERFGSNELYKKLVEEAHKRNIKVIYDHVSNHIGINHPWVENLPSPDWINGEVGNHKNANHNKTSIVDPYSNEYAEKLNETGWFTDYMIDLNQQNEFVANYIIQNTLWWIEYSGLDGIREDTYPYSNQQFMAEWAEAVMNEYQNFNIVGEVWTGAPAFLAGFQKNSKVRDFETHLPSLIDFGMRDSFYRYLSGERGLYDIYNTLAQDLLYSDPDNLMPFVDNHDVDRGMFIADGDSAKFKIALTVLLTARGIPQIFYGTEIGLNGGGHHGRIREPFPGGFTGDERNAFTEEGRTELENEIYDYLKKVISLRQKYAALSTGKLIHFMPYDETYVYFKENSSQKIMVVINGNEEEFEVDLSRMESELLNYSEFHELLTDQKINYDAGEKLLLPAKSARIYLLN